MPHMKSIRISDEVYDAALDESGLSNRSIAKQIEYWVRLGMNADKAGLTRESFENPVSADLMAAEAQRRQTTFDAVNSGQLGVTDSYMFSLSMVKASKPHFRTDIDFD